jgi:hypothetical protein
VAQEIAPEARVVYVDNDPLVLTHARAVPIGHPRGHDQLRQAAMTDTATILKHTADMLDFNEPTAVMFMGILGHFPRSRHRPHHDHRAARPVAGRELPRPTTTPSTRSGVPHAAGSADIRPDRRRPVLVAPLR